MDKLLSVPEVAELLGISVGTVYHWLSQGRLPCVRLGTRCVRFRATDLENHFGSAAERASVRTHNASSNKLNRRDKHD